MSFPIEALLIKIEIIARTYPHILFVVAGIGIILLVFIRFNEFKKKRMQKIALEKKSHSVVTSQDIKAIAGDDVMITQLDLARAYIEMDKKGLAKKILEHVVIHGNTAQKQESQQLIDKLL